MKNTLRKTLLSTILLTTLGLTADITSWKSNYDTNSNVWIELKDKPDNAQDWIGIYKAGSDNSWDNVIKWRWANDTTPTQVDKGDWYKFLLEDGKYEARFFLNNSFTVEESISFSVGGQNNEPSMKLSKSIYQENEKLSINLNNLPANNGDWVGVYAKGTSNDWGNVLRWSYTNGTKSMNKDGIEKGTLTLDGLDAGAYEARLFYNNTFELVKKVGFSVKQNNNNSVTIGAREVKSTPINKGTLFASPNGHGDCFSKESACDIYTAFSKLKAGSVLFLRGGEYTITKQLLIYHIPATQDKPVIIESYPGEIAIIQGKFISGKYAKNHINQSHVGIKIISNYTKIRKLQVRYMGHEGIMILHGNHNTIEGCELDHNILPGVVVYGGEWHENKPNYKIPYPDGKYNIIQDNIVHDNSDIGLGAKTADGHPADGGNADGIAISSGSHNSVLHNNVYLNSDDGIDTWRSNDSYVAYNISYANGLGQGDGNGIKAGGNINPNAGNGRRTIVEHNIAYNNSSRGFNWNSGRKDVFKYNTSYKNGSVGFRSGEDTIVKHNIAWGNKTSYTGQVGSNNSWQRDETVTFISTDKNSKDFLKPPAGSDFEKMGAYANLAVNDAKIFVIGDSTTFNKDFPDGNGGYKEMGWAQTEALGSYMIDKNNLFDEARSGASSKSYKTSLDNQHDWEETKELILNQDISYGAYLLIQFGHNDEHKNEEQHTTPDEFYNQLKEYVDWAKNNNITPVLITSVERRNKYKNKTHGVYPQKVKDLAVSEDITMLDLQDKSWNEYNKYEDVNAINKDLAYDDNTHFSPKGAKMVAGWVKELICESDEEKLCQQFK